MDRDDPGVHFMLQLVQNAIDIVSDQRRHAAIEDENRLRLKFPLRLQNCLAQLRFSTADDIEFGQIGIDPAQP
ncbi:hypothetical protein D3C72_2236010 [compost metagenome]